tara:strand:+ start:120 stop:521 length:402 start_codon:yes stop_codon:yes gene_type:complete
MKTFTFKLKVYYEDTDAGGVVYYANYLKFMERARSDALESLGFTNKKLRDENGIYIIVKSCNINYIKSAFLEDILEIKSTIKEITKTSFFMTQKVFKGSEQMTEAEIHLVIIDKKAKPVKIPESLNDELKKLV